MDNNALDSNFIQKNIAVYIIAEQNEVSPSPLPKY